MLSGSALSSALLVPSSSSLVKPAPSAVHPRHSYRPTGVPDTFEYARAAIG